MATAPDLRTTLATMIADYRLGEIPSMDARHVDRWIGQFPPDVRDPILAELIHVFGVTYFSRAFVQKFIDGIVTNPKFAGSDPAEFWKGVAVLDLQTAGNSQREMIALLAESVQRQCGLALNSGRTAPHTYLYLDDALFSGGRIRHDIIEWIGGDAPARAKLAVLVIGSHTLGEWFSGTKIAEAATQAGKAIQLDWWRAGKVEDRKAYIDNSDVLRPTDIPDDRATTAYVTGLTEDPILRTVGGESPLDVFSGEAGRHLLEQQLLIAGVRARGMCPHLNRYMRPLGNHLFEGLGFGSTIVTYRNCPNNTPLVFWLGDPWYPLFPRKTN